MCWHLVRESPLVHTAVNPQAPSRAAQRQHCCSRDGDTEAQRVVCTVSQSKIQKGPSSGLLHYVPGN